MSEQEFFKAQEGLLNSQQVQGHLLKELIRNAGQLNFYYRSMLLFHLQELQQAEMESAKPADPKQPDLPFIGGKP